MGAEFWDDVGPLRPDMREGADVIRDGQRYRWARNDHGVLYLRSCGQVGKHLSPRITMQEYVAQTQAMALAHEEFLTPFVKQLIGNRLILGQMEMTPAPTVDIRSRAVTYSGAIFLG